MKQENQKKIRKYLLKNKSNESTLFWKQKLKDVCQKLKVSKENVEKS